MTPNNNVKLLLEGGGARSKIMIPRNKKKSTKKKLKNTDADSHNLITSLIYKKARKEQRSGFTLPLDACTWSEPTQINSYN